MRLIYETPDDGLKEVNTKLYVAAYLDKEGNIQTVVMKDTGGEPEDYVRMMDALPDIRKSMFKQLIGWIKEFVE